MSEENFNSSVLKNVMTGHSHSFDTGIAYYFKSIDVAVVFNHIVFWLRNNKSKNKNQHDGKTWMYETNEDIADQLGYLNERQVKYCTHKLVEENFLIRSNYNKNAFDKTPWYSLFDESILDFKKCSTKEQNCPVVRTILSHPENKIVPSTYIPDKETDKEQQLVVVFSESSEEEKPSDISDQLPDYVLNALSEKEREELIQSVKKSETIPVPGKKTAHILENPDSYTEDQLQGFITYSDSMDWGITETQFKKFLKTYSSERLEAALDALASAQDVKKPLAWLTSALKEKWNPEAKETRLTNRQKVEQRFKHYELYNNAYCFLNDEGVSFERGSTHKTLSWKESGFKEKFNEILVYFNIPYFHGEDICL
jgi:hypothetical protein